MSRSRNSENKKSLNVTLDLAIRTLQKLTAQSSRSQDPPSCLPNVLHLRGLLGRGRASTLPGFLSLSFREQQPRLCQQQGREGNETGPPHCAESLPSNRQMVPLVPGRSGWPEWSSTTQAIQYFLLPEAETDNITDQE